VSDNRPVYDDGIRRRLVAITTALLIAAPTDNTDPPYFSSQKIYTGFGLRKCAENRHKFCTQSYRIISLIMYTRSPAIAEGPRDAGVPVEIW